MQGKGQNAAIRKIAQCVHTILVCQSAPNYSKPICPMQERQTIAVNFPSLMHWKASSPQVLTATWKMSAKEGADRPQRLPDHSSRWQAQRKQGLVPKHRLGCTRFYKRTLQTHDKESHRLTRSSGLLLFALFGVGSSARLLLMFGPSLVRLALVCQCCSCDTSIQ